jgi:ribosome recycling factor
MEEIFKRVEKQIQAVRDAFRKEIGGVRANRPNTAIVEDIKVSYYDQLTPVKHLGSVGVVPPREIHIQVWDKSAVQAVAKAIESASLGFSANVDGNVVRIFLPELSEERREELIKLVKKITEQHRIQVRQVRDEGNKDVQKMLDDGLCGEDDRFKGRERIQKIVDAANEGIDADCESKIKEIKE